MNRAERRRLERESKKEPTYNLKKQDIKKLTIEAADQYFEEKQSQLIRETALNSLAITVKVLHDTFGFGKKRLTNFMAKYANDIIAIDEGYADIEDFRELSKDFGIDLRIERSE